MQTTNLPTTPAPARTIVIHQAALGDFLLIFDLLRFLRGPVLLVAEGSKVKLARKLIPGLLGSDINSGNWSRLFQTDFVSDIDSSIFIKASPYPIPGVRFDGQLISFLSDGNDPWAANIKKIWPEARLFFVDPHPPSDWKEHITLWHASQVHDAQKVASFEDVPNISVPRRSLEAVLHPGAGSVAKRWPLDRFISLARTLSSRGQPVRIIASHDDMDMAGEDSQRLGTLVEQYGGRILGSLDELYESLLCARYFIGNDSGPAHLCARMGIPTLALFGPTSPLIWRPPGPNVVVLAPPEPGPMTWLTTDYVLAGIDRLPLVKPI